MKIKKLFIIAIALVCMMSFSQAAFANEVTPKVIGIGDTEATAVPIIVGPGEWFYNTSLFLSNANDVDWFKWENNTSSTVVTNGYLFENTEYTGNFRLGVKIEYANGTTTSLMFSDNNQLMNLHIPSGATAYFRVEATNFVSSSEFYYFYFTLGATS